MASPPVYRVSTVLSEPYVMKKSDGSGYQGFIVDLLDQIAGKVGFKYQFHLPSDGRYGSLNSSGHWNGMIGELVRRETDLAAADLTITSERERVVDFTKPFLSQSFRLLVKKPVFREPNLKYLLQPFSDEIWLTILFAMIVVAILFMLIGRFNPYEWRQVPEDKDPRGARHSFGLRESLMFVFSTATLQGYRETPKSLAGRVLAVFWFIFVILIVIAFIGNTIAFSMASSDGSVIPMPFDGLNDLSKQTEVRVGTVKGGSSFQKLKTSKIETYRRLYYNIQLSTPTSFVRSTEEGVERVQKSGGGFVLFMESLKGEYITSQNCDLMMYGSSHFLSGLGFATPIGSSLYHAINLALLELLEEGKINQLQKQWWVVRGRCPYSRPAKKIKSNREFRVSQMTIKRLVTPFVILLVGAILSVLVLVGEILFKKLRK